MVSYCSFSSRSTRLTCESFRRTNVDCTTQSVVVVRRNEALSRMSDSYREQRWFATLPFKEGAHTVSTRRRTLTTREEGRKTPAVPPRPPEHHANIFPPSPCPPEARLLTLTVKRVGPGKPRPCALSSSAYRSAPSRPSNATTELIPFDQRQYSPRCAADRGPLSNIRTHTGQSGPGPCGKRTQ